MALDIAQLMAMRRPEEQKHTDQIRMFEDIENGNACRCPACMGWVSIGALQRQPKKEAVSSDKDR